MSYINKFYDEITYLVDHGETVKNACVIIKEKYNYKRSVDGMCKAYKLAKEIDNIDYVVTHGHLAISNKEISKVLFEYGFQGKYNIFAKAHKHTRETKKTFKYNLIKYKDIDYVTLDSLDYRAVTVAPLFTGNFFSESLGYTSTAGFTHFVNNGKNKVTYTDFCL